MSQAFNVGKDTGTDANDSRATMSARLPAVANRSVGRRATITRACGSIVSI